MNINAFGDPLWVRENGQGCTRRGEVVGVLFISMEAVALEHHFFFFFFKPIPNYPPIKFLFYCFLFEERKNLSCYITIFILRSSD